MMGLWLGRLAFLGSAFLAFLAYVEPKLFFFSRGKFWSAAPTPTIQHTDSIRVNLEMNSKQVEHIKRLHAFPEKHKLI